MAIHVLYNCMGSSGIKPCLLCSNVFLGREKRGVVKLDTSGLAVHHTEHDHTKLQATTVGLLGAVVRRLQQGKAQLNVRSFKELQTRVGWKLDSGLERRLKIAPPPNNCLLGLDAQAFCVRVFQRSCWAAGMALGGQRRIVQGA